MLTGSAPAPAQAVRARMVATAGSATDSRGVTSSAWSIAPGLIADGSAATFALTGRYSRFLEEGWSAGGGAALDARVPVAGPASVRVEGAAAHLRDSYRNGFTTLETSPSLHVVLGRAVLFAGGRAAWARTAFDRILPGAPLGDPVLSRATVERHGLGPVFGASMRVAHLAGSGTVQLGYREDRVRVEQERFVDRAATATLAAGPVVVMAVVGRREAPSESRTFGGGRGTVALSPLVSLLGTVESYPANPLIGTPAGRTIAGGLAFTLRRAPRRGSFPSPAGIAPPTPGMTRVSIRAERALLVELAGDWNNWQPVRTTRAANGVWYADLRLPPGEYRYGFRIDGKAWTIPPGAAAVDDGFGGKAAWLTVRESGGSTETTTNRED